MAPVRLKIGALGQPLRSPVVSSPNRLRGRQGAEWRYPLAMWHGAGNIAETLQTRGTCGALVEHWSGVVGNF